MRRLPLVLLLVSPAVPAATFTVDTTSDLNLIACTPAAGDCSLRGALAAAQLAAGNDTVAFEIPTTEPGCVSATGVCTLLPATAYSSGLNGDRLDIDATTQDGWVPNTNTPEQGGSNAQLKIVLSGAACGGSSGCEALAYFGATGTVRGLVINGFRSTAIAFSGLSSPGGVVEGCFIGTDVTGSMALPNGSGVVFGGNPFGGNISVGGRVGGLLPAQRNLISGQSSGGILLQGAGHIVLGNLIGTNAAGTLALGNHTGVSLSRGSNYSQFVGDASANGRNVISGNTFAGIRLGFDGANSHRIVGNFIGTDVSGTLPLGNGALGVELNGSANAGVMPLVGGTLTGEGNVIAFNGTVGVSARGFRGHVLGNRIFRNGQLGIGSTGDNGSTSGRTPNDPADPDLPVNKGQNFPEISAYAIDGGNVDLSYRVDSAPANSAYPLRVEFFKADGDEGRDYLGFDDYTQAQAQTVKAISLPIPNGVTLTAADIVLATATDAEGNTSEFSFHPVTVTILDDGPDPSTSGTAYQVDVQAQATAGPFRPNGVVTISDGRGGSCEASLSASATALTATGNCLISTGGAPGGITLTASYDTFRHPFANGNGGNASATASHTLAPPPPEQVTFVRCVESVLEDAGSASVRVNRQGGGNVSVAFEHVAGTATQSVDYTAPASGVLSWTGSDMTPRFIDVPILTDALREPAPETFRLRLFDPLGTSITPLGLMEVRIHDAQDGRAFADGFEGAGCPQ